MRSTISRARVRGCEVDVGMSTSVLWACGQEGDGDPAEHGQAEEHSEASGVAAGGVADGGDGHGGEGFGHAVRGEDDAHDAAEDFDAVQLGGHQRNDHVVAAEADAEEDGGELEGGV